MPLTRVYMSYYQGDVSHFDYQITSQLIYLLQRANAEVIPGIISSMESGFSTSVYQELATCQWLIVIQTPQAMLSPALKMTMDVARSLVAQNTMKGIIVIKAAVFNSQDLPYPWSQLLTIDATREPQKALAKVLREISLDEQPTLLKVDRQPESPFGVRQNVPTTIVEHLPTVYANTASPVVGTSPGQLRPVPPTQIDNDDRPIVIAKPSSMRRRRNPLQLLWLILLLVLVAVNVGVIRFAYLQYASLPGVIEGSINATATAQAEATVSFAINSLQNPYLPYRGTLVLNDPLKDNHMANNWDVKPFCVFRDGAYQVTGTAQATFTYCIAGNTDYTNFAYQVQMKIIQGASGGLIFRADTATSSKFYYFLIGRDGSYNLYLTHNGGGDGDQPLVSGFSSFIYSGLNDTNLIAGVVRGNDFDLYVNAHYLTSVTDSTFSIGQIGVCVYDKTSAVKVAFHNAKVWTL